MAQLAFLNEHLPGVDVSQADACWYTEQKSIVYTRVVCEDQVQILALAVHPQHRRQGVATRIIKQLKLLYNEVHANMMIDMNFGRSCSFWHSQGFTREQCNYFINGASISVKYTHENLTHAGHHAIYWSDSD